ncbi:hypothetical protein F5B20DRAFT_281875 [Whalleya microplaca]|nr:hypothetical protein F5B20DRAFT_281875 [Whalleya microplaca]
MSTPDPGKKPPQPKSKPFDLINRGTKTPSPAGTLTFLGLRALDIPLQLALLSPTGPGISLLNSLGICNTIPHTAGAGVGSLLLAGMAGGAAAKQIYWLLALGAERFPPSAAVAVSVFNTLVNGANALLFLAGASSGLTSRPLVTLPLPFSIPELGLEGEVTLPLSMLVGAGLYVAGLAIETGAEVQRRAFKRKPGNEGRVCKTGLWAWVRHPNYAGYALWRGGYCMVATGWVGGIAMALFQGWDFATRAVVVLDGYCAERYKEQWTRFKEEVPYKLVPGIY